MGSAVPFRVSPLVLHTQTESDWLVLTHGIPSFLPLSEIDTIDTIDQMMITASIYTVNRHQVSPQFIGSRNCAPMEFTAESPPAQGQ